MVSCLVTLSNTPTSSSSSSFLPLLPFLSSKHLNRHPSLTCWYLFVDVLHTHAYFLFLFNFLFSLSASSSNFKIVFLLSYLLEVYLWAFYIISLLLSFLLSYVSLPFLPFLFLQTLKSSSCFNFFSRSIRVGLIHTHVFTL